MSAESVVIVKRNTPGAAVSAQSGPDKQPKAIQLSLFQHPIQTVNEEQLTELLASRQPFDEVAVPRELAERVLGWTVSTDEGESTS